jgi:hypothetical protein
VQQEGSLSARAFFVLVESTSVANTQVSLFVALIAIWRNVSELFGVVRVMPVQ